MTINPPYRLDPFHKIVAVHFKTGGRPWKFTVIAGGADNDGYTASSISPYFAETSPGSGVPAFSGWQAIGFYGHDAIYPLTDLPLLDDHGNPVGNVFLFQNLLGGVVHQPMYIDGAREPITGLSVIQSSMDYPSFSFNGTDKPRYSGRLGMISGSFDVASLSGLYAHLRVGDDETDDPATDIWAQSSPGGLNAIQSQPNSYYNFPFYTDVGGLGDGAFIPAPGHGMNPGDAYTVMFNSTPGRPDLIGVPF